MAQYLPAFRPGDTVTFDVTTAVVGGRYVEVGTADRSVAPAGAVSLKVVGVAGHDAAIEVQRYLFAEIARHAQENRHVALLADAIADRAGIAQAETQDTVGGANAGRPAAIDGHFGAADIAGLV